MGHLGDFGTEREDVEDTFGYFGATLRVNPSLSDLEALEAFRAVEAAETNATILDALHNVLTTLVHPEDVDECWRLARLHRQGLEDIATFSQTLLGALTDRPTSLPSDSSDGQATTDTSSTDDSSSRALRALDGRPDLQIAVLRAEAG